ncbi:hypothetical protein [uncultured Veillonella sp.]|uniref:hypothetical protein n=1 Tax=uncultured Veillonella sp. TaxID=159268 RepID=UPI00261B15D1|nr:hypothetical protein [uncultured Veillonella sp.]
MKDKINITFQKGPLAEPKLKEISKLLQISFDSDDIKVKAIYNNRLVGNAKYIDNELVCNNCESSSNQFQFIMHAVTENKEREVYKCQHCGQDIFTLYDYQDHPKKTF